MFPCPIAVVFAAWWILIQALCKTPVCTEGFQLLLGSVCFAAFLQEMCNDSCLRFSVHL